MPNYFITAPSILSQRSFVAYGGVVGTATPAQLTAAFTIAEGWCASEIGCPLTPTVITGTYSWPGFGGVLQLPCNHIQQVYNVTALDDDGLPYGAALDSFILHGDSGIIAFGYETCPAMCDVGKDNKSPQVQVTFLTGWPSGTISKVPQVMLALTTIAGMAIKQMSAPYELEGGPGAIGVQEFSDGPYREVRTKLFATMAGTSPLAAFARELLEQVGLRVHRALRLY